MVTGKFDDIVAQIDSGLFHVMSRRAYRSMVEHLKPWSNIEYCVVNYFDLGIGSGDCILAELWSIFDQGDGNEFRLRLFIGIIASDEPLDGYSAGMLYHFSRMSGIDDESIATSLRGSAE